MWEDSDACLIENAENVQLRSFDTKVALSPLLRIMFDIIVDA